MPGLYFRLTLKASHQNKHQQNYNDDAKRSTTVVASAVEWAAARGSRVPGQPSDSCPSTRPQPRSIQPPRRRRRLPPCRFPHPSRRRCLRSRQSRSGTSSTSRFALSVGCDISPLAKHEVVECSDSGSNRFRPGQRYNQSGIWLRRKVPHSWPGGPRRLAMYSATRRSIPSLRTPLSTLRLQPHDHTRMTRGRCSSLRLHRDGLAPSTFRRSPGAPVHSINSGHQIGLAKPPQMLPRELTLGVAISLRRVLRG